jgi:sigma-E factor negative regulatory protein RseC
MIEERAVILSLQPMAANEQIPQTESVATIEIVRKTACGLCGQTRGCGNSLWGKLFGHKTTNFTAQNGIGAKVGDHVIVGIEESVIIKSALVLYIVPLVGMLLGAWLGKSIYATDGATMLAGVLGLLVGFVWVKGHAQGSAYYRQNQPRILRLDQPGTQAHPIEFR